MGSQNRRTESHIDHRHAPAHDAVKDYPAFLVTIGHTDLSSRGNTFEMNTKTETTRWQSHCCSNLKFSRWQRYER